MKNVDLKVNGKTLIITVDLSAQGSPSRSGKSIVIASTEGNQAIAPGVYAGVNVYRKR